MSERISYPPAEQPNEPEDFTRIPAPEGETGTYQLPNTPHRELPPAEERPAFDHQSNQWTPNNDNGPKGDPNKFAKIVGGITAGAVLLGGGVLGYQKVMAGRGEGDPNEGKRPAASGPAVPGEKAPAMSENMELTPEGIEFPVRDENGNVVETVKGVEAYKKHLQLNVEQYPTPKEALAALPSRFNEFVQFGHTEDQRKALEAYTSSNGSAPGASGVHMDIFTPAFTEALMAKPDPELDIWQADANPAQNLIYGGFKTDEDLKRNYFCLDRVGTRFNIATKNDPSLQPKLVLDKTEGFRESGITAYAGNDEIGYTATFYLKAEGVQDESEGATFEAQVTLLKVASPEGMQWKIVSGFTVPGEGNKNKFYGK